MKKLFLLVSIFLATGSSCANTKAIREDIPTSADLPIACSCQATECVDMAKMLCQLKNKIGISDCGDYTVFQLLCLIKNSIGSDLSTVESKIDIIDDNVDMLVGCAYTPLTQDDVVGGLLTLDTSGNYCLSTDLTATVTITADNVCLCLNNRELTGHIIIDADNVTVKEGSITAQSDGITLVNNSNCRLQDVDVIGGESGYRFQSSDANIVTNCRAMGCTYAGFLLETSDGNKFSQCAAYNIAGPADVFGFLSRGGDKNVFEECSAKKIKTESSYILDAAGWLGAVAGGLVFEASETSGLISQCQVDEVTSVTTGANGSYGIWLKDDSVFTGTGLSEVATTTDPDGNVYSVAWLVDGDTKYLAAGGNSGVGTNEVKVFSFDGSTLTEVAATSDPDGIVRSVAWLIDGDTKYLATGSSGGATDEVKVFRFDESLPLASRLTEVAATSDPDGFVYSVAWLVDGDTKYLAAGGDSGAGTNEVKVFSFDGSTLTEVAATDAPDGTVLSVAWLVDGDTKYLATASFLSATNEVRVFSFDGSTLTEVAATDAPDGFVYSVAWLVDGDTKYLATGGEGTDEVKVFELTGDLQERKPENCTIINNSVSGVESTVNSLAASSTLTGIGMLADSAANYIAQNVSCNNNTNYQGVDTQYLASQANAHGVDNIDCSRTEVDQYESKLDYIIANLP